MNEIKGTNFHISHLLEIFNDTQTDHQLTTIVYLPIPLILQNLQTNDFKILISTIWIVKRITQRFKDLDNSENLMLSSKAFSTIKTL